MRVPVSVAIILLQTAVSRIGFLFASKAGMLYRTGSTAGRHRLGRLFGSQPTPPRTSL
jgi:hypothetical protein